MFCSIAKDYDSYFKSMSIKPIQNRIKRHILLITVNKNPSIVIHTYIIKLLVFKLCEDTLHWRFYGGGGQGGLAPPTPTLKLVKV